MLARFKLAPADYSAIGNGPEGWLPTAVSFARRHCDISASATTTIHRHCEAKRTRNFFMCVSPVGSHKTSTLLSILKVKGQRYCAPIIRSIL